MILAKMHYRLPMKAMCFMGSLLSVIAVGLGHSERAVAQAGALASKGGEFGASIYRISPKRTVLQLELDDGVSLSPGAKISLKGTSGAVQGEVKKINSDGRAIVRIKSALPERMNTGSAVTFTVDDAGNQTEVVNVESAKQRSFWREKSMLSSNESQGINFGAVLSADWGNGTNKVSGGTAKEEVSFGVSESLYDFDGSVGYRTGGHAAGVKFCYAKSKSMSEAEIDTAATATKDKDSILETSSGYNSLLHYSFTSKNSNFGMGLGWQMGKMISERTVEIASIKGPHNPVIATESGVKVELMGATSSFKVGVGILLGAKGKITEKDQKEVDRVKSEYSGFIAGKAVRVRSRLGISMETSVDKYTTSDLMTSKTGVDFQTQFSGALVYLIPRLFYEMSKVTFGTQEGSGSVFSLGTKVVVASSMNPFFAVDIKMKSQSEKATATKPSYTEKLWGFAFAAGVNL